MTFFIAPIEPASSKRSEEIEARAGIAFPNTKGPFAPKEKFFFIYVTPDFGFYWKRVTFATQQQQQQTTL